MVEDPIVAEVRAAREKLFAECNEDLDAFLDRLREEKPPGRARATREIKSRKPKLRPPAK
jgi:hypothetical protein